MAYFEVEGQAPTKPFRLVLTLIMSGIVALSAWELWGRHLAPHFYGHELASAGIIQVMFGIKNRLVAEAVYFPVAIPFLSTVYLFLWRPLLCLIAHSRHWLLSGLSYGGTLFLASQAVLFYLARNPSHEGLIEQSVSGWFMGTLLTGITLSGFVHLCELGRKII